MIAHQEGSAEATTRMGSVMTTTIDQQHIQASTPEEGPIIGFPEERLRALPLLEGLAESTDPSRQQLTR